MQSKKGLFQGKTITPSQTTLRSKLGSAYIAGFDKYFSASDLPLDMPPSNRASQTAHSPVVFVVGPTASGKSRLALFLAQRFDGEIINADSRQVYRRMDIGTAKPSLAEQAQAPHHLLDICDPGENFNLACFMSRATTAIDDIHGRGRLPIVAGGSGQYVWGLLDGWQVPATPPQPQFRRDMLEEAQRNGPMSVYRQLQEADPDRAAQLDPRNLRRVIRALEVHHFRQPSGSPPAQERRPLENCLIVGLTMPREELYRRIDRRVDRMQSSGLLEEAQGLSDKGYQLGQGPLSSPGYRELGQYLASEISLEEAVQRTKFQTHRLARRQYTWFKLQDPRINWVDGSDPEVAIQAADLVAAFLSSRSCYGRIGPHTSPEAGS